MPLDDIQTTNTKLLRLESITDKALAYIISLPAPLSFAVVLGNLLGAFAAGIFVGHVL